MPKRSEIQIAIDKLDADILVLTTARDLLVKVQTQKPKRTRKATKPQAAEKEKS